MQYRQGDVFIERTKDKVTGKPVPRDAQGRVVLAYGEVTGHAHAIYGAQVLMFRDDALARTFLTVKEKAELVHEEHDTIVIEPGDYEIIHQREYRPEEIRRVAD